jgi:hypothetical protein
MTSAISPRLHQTITARVALLNNSIPLGLAKKAAAFL